MNRDQLTLEVKAWNPSIDGVTDSDSVMDPWIFRLADTVLSLLPRQDAEVLQHPSLEAR